MYHISKATDVFATDDEVLQLSKKLSMHMNNKLFFNPMPFGVHHKARIYESYATKNLRQSFFEECVFEKANFEKSSLSGSIFVNSRINPCNFKDTNLQSCDFRNCTFNGILFEYTRMNKSVFYNARFINCTFVSASINDAIFDGCKFSNCKWIPVSIENTIFRNTFLSNVTFRSMNFEFVTFENIKTENIKFPFPTIPFIYNGLTYVTETTDNIRITSAQQKDGLTAKEYLENIPDLEKFYYNTQNYFPLSNIYISQKRFIEAFEAIVSEIELAINLRSFRMIKNYCKQIKYIPTINFHQRQELYNRILTQLSGMKLHEFEKDNLKMYLPEARELILTDTDRQRLQIFAITNISDSDYEKVSLLISYLDGFLHSVCRYSIELRHNSPYEIFLDIFTDPENISLIISGLSLIVGVMQLKQGHNNCQNNEPNNGKITKHKELSDVQKNECEQKNQNLTQNQIVIEKVIINNNGNIYVNSNINSIGD